MILHGIKSQRLNKKTLSLIVAFSSLPQPIVALLVFCQTNNDFIGSMEL